MLPIDSGLALAILFTFYPSAGEMLVVAGFWGVWHLMAGLSLAGYWNYCGRGGQPGHYRQRPFRRLRANNHE